MSAHAESPLTETPLSQRKGFLPIALVLLFSQEPCSLVEKLGLPLNLQIFYGLWL